MFILRLCLLGDHSLSFQAIGGLTYVGLLRNPEHVVAKVSGGDSNGCADYVEFVGRSLHDVGQVAEARCRDYDEGQSPLFCYVV